MQDFDLTIDMEEEDGAWDVYFIGAVSVAAFLGSDIGVASRITNRPELVEEKLPLCVHLSARIGLELRERCITAGELKANLPNLIEEIYRIMKKSTEEGGSIDGKKAAKEAVDTVFGMSGGN